MRFVDIAFIRGFSAALLVALGGCGSFHAATYRDEIADNQQRLLDLKTGMTRAEIFEVMGQGELVHYRRILLIDPWRVEEFQVRADLQLQLIYYVTTHPRSYGAVKDSDLTPLVLENGKLVGWGWMFMRAQRDRYGIALEPAQPAR